MKIAFTHNQRRSASEQEAEFYEPEMLESITGALASGGHQVEPIEVSTSVPDLITRLTRFAPDLIFNTAEGSVRASRCRHELA